MKEQIAIYGGTFDPIHTAHLEIIKYLSENYKKVLVVPTTVRYYKKNVCMFSFNYRLEAIQEKIENLPNVEVLDIEREVGSNWRYIHTLADIRLKYPNEKFVTVIGSDSLANFETWYDYKDILKHSELLVIKRPRYEIKEHDFDFEVVDSINNDISSTKLREELKDQMDREFDEFLYDIGWADKNIDNKE